MVAYSHDSKIWEIARKSGVQDHFSFTMTTVNQVRPSLKGNRFVCVKEKKTQAAQPNP